jgi:hypothetical protein
MAEARRDRDSLENNKNNQEAIELIQELYGVDVKIATELWHRFIGTVEKMELIATRQTSQSS